MATPLTLPVTQVLVMEDRAQVERLGQVVVSRSGQPIELAGLSVLTVDRSLKVEVRGATFADAKLDRRWRLRPKGGLGPDASEIKKRVDGLECDVVLRADLVARAEARVELLAGARADLLRAIAEYTGFGKADVAGWSEQLGTISTRQRESDEALRGARLELLRVQSRLEEARAALVASDEKERDLECFLVLSLDGDGPAEVRVSYLVPCAVWRPAYRASLGAGTVLVEAEAVLWQSTGEEWNDVRLSFSTSRPTLGTMPPSLREDRLRTRPKAEEEKKVTEVAIREEVIETTGEGGAPQLPGLDDGGEARLLVAQGTFTIKSDGQPHRVPLFSFESKADLERVCPAELTHLVSLVARFPNTSGQVLLAGPVDLVRQSGFIGRSQLSFAAPGELVKVSFGSEDGLTIVRSTDEKVDEARLTGRRTTARRVTLHISNARPEAAKLVVEERIPVSEVKEVEIQILSRECSPPPSIVTKEGIARIEIELPPRGTRTATFAWELSAAGKVAGV